MPVCEAYPCRDLPLQQCAFGLCRLHASFREIDAAQTIAARLERLLQKR
jgi:hypothetical protein